MICQSNGLCRREAEITITQYPSPGPGAWTDLRIGQGAVIGHLSPAARYRDGDRSAGSFALNQAVSSQRVSISALATRVELYCSRAVVSCHGRGMRGGKLTCGWFDASERLGFRERITLEILSPAFAHEDDFPLALVAFFFAAPHWFFASSVMEPRIRRPHDAITATAKAEQKSTSLKFRTRLLSSKPPADSKRVRGTAMQAALTHDTSCVSSNLPK